MLRTPITLLILLLTAACGPGADPRPLLQRAADTIDAGGMLTGSLYLRQEGEFQPSGNAAAKVPYVSETLLILPDRMVTRTSVAGVVTIKGVEGGKAWVRSGAAVRDFTGDAAAEERADRDDLLALLVRPLLGPAFELSRSEDSVKAARPGERPRTIEFDPGTGFPRRLVRTSRNARGGTGEMVRSFSGWTGFGAIRFPTAIGTDLGGGRLRLTTKTVELDPADTRGLSTRRPRDRAKTRTGPIRRVPEPGGNFLLVRQRGTYVDLAKVDALLANGCRQAFATRLGPIRRVFHDLPDKDGVAVIGSLVPVRFEHVEDARKLPKGVEAARLPEVETLAMKITGPYPRDRSLENALLNYGKDLGLEAAGPARYLVLSDPDAGEPEDLEMEIRLPVRNAK
ncbi:MAG: hypothetical protein ABFS86_00805 [Planctomycetota bacterium]